jgi:hypothetical protein
MKIFKEHEPATGHRHVSTGAKKASAFIVGVDVDVFVTVPECCDAPLPVRWIDATPG